jgi:hypothetical protein
VRRVALGHHHQPGGALVQAVNDAGAHGGAAAAAAAARQLEGGGILVLLQLVLLRLQVFSASTGVGRQQRAGHCVGSVAARRLRAQRWRHSAAGLPPAAGVAEPRFCSVPRRGRQRRRAF